jgi:hypothetical protein
MIGQSYLPALKIPNYRPTKLYVYKHKFSDDYPDARKEGK